ncbi:hypothetical protein J8273_8333 [Carpediemonas membranifera]|uniref:SRP9 domain-containing protein n=1 Tax=Carpediemonas membranifera TaxID=201153 RepID=A0A8J6DZ64_9EUKA|nr:hypothetical protein J8273_8333 [Carpediemonas membranifera]|eukprot:KAG9390293.1 hypothetical protein J8273_8333 [Carpediemonas membranifera]
MVNAAVYVDSVAQFSKLAEEMAASDRENTRFTFTVKKDTNQVVLKVTDDKKVIKFKTDKAVMLDSVFSHLMLTFSQ